MRLHIGERLSGAGPASQPGGYVVSEVIHETPWTGWYAGRKIFYNFDFTDNRPRETDDKEWLLVYLRTLQYPHLDDRDDVVRRRRLARAESRWLGRGGSNLWPEPLDLLEINNTRDPFAFSWNEAADDDAPEQEPVLVLARPHGELLTNWRKQARPISAKLSVLAELLHLVQHAHHEGLVLHGLGPESLLIDRADRLHFIGTDMVIDAVQSADPQFAKLYDRKAWSRLFPAHRYPRGYAPPECFNGNQLPDVRCDLYSWAALAFTLLTGSDAEEQITDPQSGWLHFQQTQFDNLERSLRAIPPAHVRSWAQQLGVDAGALVSQWPRSFLHVFQALTSPLPWRRPSSVTELRSWLTSPPPLPVDAVFALQARPNVARIRWRFPDGADPDEHEVIVRRGIGVSPQNADDGELVVQGDGLLTCDDPIAANTEHELFYSVFVRSHESESEVFSPGHTATLTPVAPEHLRRFVDDDWHGSVGEHRETARMELLFESIDLLIAAKALYTSGNANTRWCVVHRLAEQPVLAADDPLLWKALRDADPAVRLEAARGVLHGTLSFEKVSRVAERLGDDVDDRIEWARSLSAIGVDASVIQQTIADLEGKRPTTCPVCEMELAGSDRTSHLRNEHDWVEALGMLWPREEALIRLWERIFREGDLVAHQQLCGILDEDGAVEGSPYVAALQNEMKRRSAAAREDGASTIVQHEFGNLIACIQHTPALRPLASDFLRTADEHVRELGRELILPELHRRLEDGATAERIRAELDRLCPHNDLLDEKVLLCTRLTPLGVDAVAVSACQRRLEGERPVRCTECHKLFYKRDIEVHLRRGHNIFEYQGTRRTYDETRVVLLRAVCGTSPDYEAWQTLEAIARERYGDKVTPGLAAWLCQTIRTVHRERRLQTLGVVAEAASRSPLGDALAMRLTEPFSIPNLDVTAHALALEIVKRLPSPVAMLLVAKVQPLLGERTLPIAIRQKAVAALIRTTGDSGSATRSLLEAYLGTSGKLKCVDKLQQLEPLAGHVTEIDVLLQELEDQVRMNCPRCGVQLQRIDMATHLWDNHRLVLEGRRVREPWRVIKDWLDDYNLEKDEAVLQRCRDLAEQLDGDAGKAKLHRLMLNRGIENQEALQKVLRRARRDGSSVCPHCFHRAAPETFDSTDPFQWIEYTLTGNGYRLRLIPGGLVARAEIENPDGFIDLCRQPGGLLTRAGALTFITAPLVALISLFAFLLAGTIVPVAASILIAFGSVLLLGGMVFLLWPGPRDATDVLIDLAWLHLASQWLDFQRQPKQAAALRDLAIVSRGVGDPSKRHGFLRSIQQISEQFDGGVRATVASAAVQRLALEDAAGQAVDPVPWMVEWASPCFLGQRAIAWLDEFLDGFDQPKRAPTWWTAQRRTRLEVLLCDKAFEYGLEVADLVELGKAFPRLGRILRWDDENLLAHRRFVWSKMSLPPWDHYGDVETVFDLAHEGRDDGEWMQHFPDLLLDVPSVPLRWCANAVVFENRRIAEMPASIDILERNPYDDVGYDMVIGNERVWFRNQPDRIAQELEKSLRYFFFDLQPQVSSVLQWRSTEVTKRIRQRNAVNCSHCGEKLVLIVGEMGLKCEDEGSSDSLPQPMYP